MKKTLIALAVLAASGASFAQSAVTLSGALVMAAGNITEGAAPTKLTLARPTSNLTLSGAEDLGGGLKASFAVQQGIYGYTTASQRASIGTTGNTVGNFGDRQAFLALTGDFGTVKIGRDLNGGSQLVGAANVSGVNAVTGLDDSKADAVWYGNARSNSLSYQTPTMNGVSAFFGVTPVDYDGMEASAASKTIGSNAAGTTSISGALTALNQPVAASTFAKRPSEYGLTYSAGPLNAGLVVTDYVAQKTVAVAANYDLGVAKFGVGFQKISADNKTDTESTVVSVSAPLSGALSFGAAYGTRSATTSGAFTAAETKHTMFGLNYALSKRTTLFAVYNKKDSTTDDTNYGQVNDWKEATVGVKHSF